MIWSGFQSTKILLYRQEIFVQNSMYLSWRRTVVHYRQQRAKFLHQWRSCCKQNFNIILALISTSLITFELLLDFR